MRNSANGAVVFVVDESASMNAKVAGGTKSKAESVATALNSLLAQLSAGPAVDVAVVGYRAGGDGGTDVGCRWGGPLAGRELVSTAELPAAPLAVEDRTRRIPAPGGVGVAREETVKFPVWYVPQLGGAAPRQSAFASARQMLAGWLAAAGASPKPPMIVHLVGDVAPGEAGPIDPAALCGPETPNGPTLVLHAHLGTSPQIPPVLYPSTDAHLRPGQVRSLFTCASPLPPPLAGELRRAQVAVNAGARGLIYDAKMVDLIRFFSVVKAYAAFQPPAAGTAPPAEAPAPAEAQSPAPVSSVAASSPPWAATPAASASPSPAEPPAAATGVETPASRPAPGREQIALIVLLLDRAVEDPTAGKTAWHRLQDEANELLGRIGKRGGGRIDVAVVSYGANPAGCLMEVENTLAGRPVLRDDELAGAALRVEQVTEKVSNGIGGLVEITRKKPVFVDLSPAPFASPDPAVEAVAELLGAWTAEHPGTAVPPIVVHFTRGRLDPEASRAVAAQLGQAVASGESPLVYHVVVTETPHRSVAYPPDPSMLDLPELVALWETTGPLVGREALSSGRPTVSPGARGMVVNAKFDLLPEAVLQILAE